MTEVLDTEPKKRGGPRGERPWRDKPTARERVLNGSLAEFIKDSTGRDVSAESVRAVRFCLLKWTNSDATKKLREDMDSKLAKAKLQDKREKALAMLKEAESELSKLGDTADDVDEDDDEDDEDEDTEDDSDSDDEDEDVFGDDEKVSASFG